MPQHSRLRRQSDLRRQLVVEPAPQPPAPAPGRLGSSVSLRLPAGRRLVPDAVDLAIAAPVGSAFRFASAAIAPDRGETAHLPALPRERRVLYASSLTVESQVGLVKAG